MKAAKPVIVAAVSVDGAVGIANLRDPDQNCHGKL